MERRITNLTEERQNLNMTLEESSDRILLLEKHNIEQENKIRTQQKDLEELRHANSIIQNKLDSFMRRNGSSDMPNSNGHHSLFNEIEMSSQSSNDEDLRSLNGNNSCFNPEDEIDSDDHELSFISTHSDNWKVSQTTLNSNLFGLIMCYESKLTVKDTNLELMI